MKNKQFAIIRKLGAILQTKNATKEDVTEAYKNSSFKSDKTNKDKNT